MNFTSESEPDAAAQELDCARFALAASNCLNIDDKKDGLMDFNELSNCPIVGAASASLDRDVCDDYDEPDELLRTLLCQLRAGP